MAAVSTSRRALAGIILIIAGVLYALAVLLPLANVTLSFLFPLAYLAIAVALVVLALGAVNGTVTKISLFVGAVGWFILALGGLFALPGVATTIAAVLAALGTLIGAIVLYVGKEVTNTAALAFVITAIIAVLLLLPVLVPTIAFGAVAVVIAIAFAVALVITGVLFRRPERASRR